MRLDPRELQQQIANLYLEYPELKDDDAMRVDMLEGATSMNEMLTAILRGIDEAQFLSDGINSRVAELKKRKDRCDLKVEFLRAMILKVMRWADLRKVQLPDATLSQIAGRQKIIGDVDVALLPEELVKIERTPDRTKIREALERGDLVPGCSLSNAEPVLAVHVK
jgi:hypothetical protein